MPNGLNSMCLEPNACLFSGCSDRPIWVEHHSEVSADCSWWKVFSEACSHGSRVSMSLNNFTPNALEVCTVLGVLCSVNVSNALAEVESTRFAVVDALNFN